MAPILEERRHGGLGRRTWTKDLDEVFEELEDPRTGNAKRHLLHEVMMIALCTVLCGGETCADMALFGRSKRDFLQDS
jgi:DDE_Tnp_1-associated